MSAKSLQGGLLPSDYCGCGRVLVPESNHWGWSVLAMLAVSWIAEDQELVRCVKEE
jgi:hypothetical protein